MFNNVNTHRCFIMSMMYIRNLVGLHLNYYTDTHDVDEDMRAMTIHGDHWEYGSMAGITMRYMGYTPTYTWDRHHNAIYGLYSYLHMGWCCLQIQ